MKKRLYKIFISCLVLCVCMAMAAPLGYAEGDTTYVISFRPGEHGSFDQGAVGYLSSFGTAQMTAAGNIFVEVPSGTPFPAGILSYLSADEGYYYKDGLAGGTVTEDATYVAQFGILSGGGVRYTVKYVDSVSGTELAESYTGYANEGDVIPFAAKTVTGYDVDSAGKSITVTEGAEISFLYTSNGALDEIRYEYGENTIETQTVAAPPAPDNGGNDNNGENDNPEEEIDENETPLGSGESDGEEIDENDTPLAPGLAQNAKDETESKGSVIGVAAAIAAAVLIVIAVAVVLTRKKKSYSAK